MSQLQFQFLSDEWIEASRALHEEYRDFLPPPPVAVRMNQVLTGVPFGAGIVHAHLDTSSGWAELGAGHLDSPDLTVTLDYETARSLFVGADPTAAMAAFLSGRMRVDGDITKLIALQSGAPGLAGYPAPAGPELADPGQAGPEEASGPDGDRKKVAELLSRLQAMTA